MNTLLLLLVLCPLLGSGVVAGVAVLAVTTAWLARYCMVDLRRGRSLAARSPADVACPG